MFKCGICKESSKPNEKPVRVVIETRAVVYPFIRNAHVFKTFDGKTIVKDDPGGKGFETVKEVLAHRDCA